MSGRLVGEVAEWLCTPAAADLTAAERVVLLIIAERANEKTRQMWRHRSDDTSLSERIRAATGLNRTNLAKVFNKLAERGLEVRVQVGVTKSGRPVFAHKGHATDFRLPDLPASVQLPESVAPARPNDPVDNPPGDAPEEPADDPERVAQTRPIERKASRRRDTKTAKGSHQCDPHPSKDNPSTTDPSSCGSPKWVAEEEDTPPAAPTPSGESSHRHMGWEPTYREASALLQTLPDLGGEYMAAAEHTLDPGMSLADRVIYAAQLAKEAMAS